MAYPNNYQYLDQFTSTPPTPTSAYLWDQDHLDLSAPQAFDHQHAPPASVARFSRYAHAGARVVSSGSSASGPYGSPLEQMSPVHGDLLDFSPPTAGPSHGASASPGGEAGPVSSSVSGTRPMSAAGAGAQTTGGGPPHSVPRAQSARAPSRPPSAQGARAAGPVRAPRAHVSGPHPYRRPSAPPPLSPVAEPTPSDALPQRTAAPQRQRREVPQLQAMRFIQYHPPLGSPAVAVGCPAQGKRREGSPAQLAQKATSPRKSSACASTAAALDKSTTSNPDATMSPPRRLYARTDMHYDPSSRLMTATLELPGLKKRDIRLELARCPYARVKQLRISGSVRPLVSGPEAYMLRERKFGDFTRTIVLPPDTKKEDVFAHLEDGLLVLKVPVGPPAEPEDPTEVDIR